MFFREVMSVRKEFETFGTRDVYRAVAERENFRKDHTRLALDTFAAVVAEALAAGKAVRYSGLGTFKPAIRKRKRRGKDARYVTVLFRPAPAVLRVLNQKGGERDEQSE